MTSLAAGLSDDFFLRLAISMVAVLAVVLSMTVLARRGREVAFSYVMFGLVIFLIAFVLKSTEVSVGFGFGLFAVFGVLRYRTEELPIRDLTYLLIVIAVAMVNAVANFGMPALVMINVLLVVGTILAQWITTLRHEELRRVTYERIALIQPERRTELLADLSARLGMRVMRVEIGDVDFMRDTAVLTVWCRATDDQKNLVSEARQSGPGLPERS